MICPAQRLGFGEFGVVSRPGARYNFDPAALAPDPLDPAYIRRPAGAPRGVFVPTPEQLELPHSVDDLEGWLVAVLPTAPDDALVSALDQAETSAAQRFSGEQIVKALRRVLSTDLHQ